MWSGVTKRVGQTDPGDRLTLPVKFRLHTQAIFIALAKATLAQGLPSLL